MLVGAWLTAYKVSPRNSLTGKEKTIVYKVFFLNEASCFTVKQYD